MNDLQQRLLYILVMLWRRRWLALGVAWLVCAVGWSGVAILPVQYEAKARIYVDTDSLLAPLLKGMAVDINNSNRQIDIMQRTLLSRPNLESVLRKHYPWSEDASAAERQGMVDWLASNTTIRPQGNNLFAVTYRNADPREAAAVVDSLLTIFVENHVATKRREMEQARRFIDGQIEQYEQQLQAAERRLAEFKSRHVGRLPETGDNATAIEQARARLVQTRGELEDAITRRLALTEELSEVPQFLSVANAPQVVIQGRAVPTELQARITAVQTELDGLTLRYTDKHPDVMAARRMLEALQEQEAEAQAAAVAGSPDSTSSTAQRISNPVYEQIRLKLVDAEAEVQTAQRRYAEQEAELARLRELAATAPAIEAEYKDLNRDYNVIKKNYEELLDRRETAKLSQEIDLKADKVQFRIVDPPQVPSWPSSPDRPLLLSAVLLAGIGGGLGLAFVFVQISEPIGTVQQLRDAFALPVLGSISAMTSALDRRRRALGALAFAAGLFSLLVACAAVYLLLTRPLPDFT